MKICANERCSKPFDPNRQDQIYCALRCQKLTSKRNYAARRYATVKKPIAPEREQAAQAIDPCPLQQAWRGVQG